MALLLDRHIHFDTMAVTEMAVLTEKEYPVRRRGLDEELVTKIVESQSRRLEDQRTPLPLTSQEESFLNLVSSVQGSRLDDQRASLHLETPPLSPTPSHHKEDSHLDDDELLDLIYKCQRSRINKQRSLDPKSYWRNLMPGEDFFNLLQHLQSLRIEDQRSPLPIRL